MAQDKKFYIAILLIFFIALINIVFDNFLPDDNRLVIKKNMLAANKTFDYVLVGGSNSKWGLNTSEYTSSNSDIFNLSILFGGFNFKNYSDHLINLKVNSRHTIYSSNDILHLNKKDSIDNFEFNIYGQKINRFFLWIS